MRRFATRIASGVFLIIFGVACSLFFFPLGEDNAWINTSENFSAIFSGLGLLVLFAGIVLGLATIIPAGMQHRDFVKEHPYLVDFYTKDQKDEARTLFVRQLIAGIASIFLGVCAAVFLSISTKTEALGAGLVMLFVPQCHTPYFWLSWTIGGLACALVSLLVEATNKD